MSTKRLLEFGIQTKMSRQVIGRKMRKAVLEDPMLQDVQRRVRQHLEKQEVQKIDSTLQKKLYGQKEVQKSLQNVLKSYFFKQKLQDIFKI